MRAFQVVERGRGEVVDVDPPVAGPGQVVVDVARVGICGTDTSLFFGDEARIARNRLTYPIRLGHEWSGTISHIGEGVDPTWNGRRVTGDTLVGCGHCARCLDGRHHLCDDRAGIGVRRNWPGALAEKLLVPESSLRGLPDAVSDEQGALVEPGANAYRAVEASGVGPNSRTLVLGSGNIGLLVAQFALAAGSEVHVIGIDADSLALARELGVHGVWQRGRQPEVAWDAVIDATNAPEMPQFALDTAEPGRTVVLIGVSLAPSMTDSRRIVHKELHVHGILGGSLGLESTIAAYASGAVDPRPLIAATVSLEEVPDIMAGRALRDSGAGPKVLVDPNRADRRSVPGLPESTS
jgi:threonine dehydrogenase-like Zn-dependent dehydrogenase